MERPFKGRSVSDYESRPRRSTSSETAFTSSSTTHVYSAVTSVSAAAGKRRHVHHVSLPHNQLATYDAVAHYSRPLSPYEERIIGITTHSVGIPLAEPNAPAPTVTGKIISSVKRGFSMKREKTPPVDDSLQHVTRLPSRPTTPQISLVSGNNGRRVRSTQNQAIITAHRSPFGGYTKSGDFVMTRTADGQRLPTPQPHPHAYKKSRVSLPPPAQSALKKSSAVSIESGDSYTLVNTPDSASSVGSVNGGSNPGLVRNKSMLAKLMGKTHKKSVSMSMVPSDMDVTQSAVKKAVRFTIDAEETA